jgi:hypothetical protein
MLTLLATTPSTNDKNGNGKYKPLRRRKKQKKNEENSNEFKYLKTSELTMKFNTSKDPIYYVFENLESRSVTQLMGDFIQDSFFEITNFVSKVIK